MSKHEKKKVLAVLEDLLFTVKIGDVAKRMGLDVEFVKSEIDAMDRARQGPLLIILDLNARSVDPIKLIGDLKNDPDTKSVILLAYVSHVQGDLKQSAHEAGCDIVLARSAFSQNLPTLLRRHSSVI
jgi:CheY-like chemotaxis protein